MTWHENVLTCLVIIFAGAMLGFSLARLEYLDLRNFSKGAAPGEWYWYQAGHRRIGLLIHLAAILPAGILMIFQFIPSIRQRAVLFHRINGHVILVLVLISNAGALMIARHAFGGEIATQAAVGQLVLSTTVGLSLAYYNIKKLQVDQHRAWMLRSMFYLGSIITTRLIMALAALITSSCGTYSVIMTCGELGSMHGFGYLAETYPDCIVNSTILRSDLKTVRVNILGGLKEEVGASLRLNFGMAIWLAFFLHGVGVEIYLALTPREAQRLRMVSYERQLEAGMSNAGSAGLVADRIGDAQRWQPTLDDGMAGTGIDQSK
jgi:hypothetical protein